MNSRIRIKQIETGEFFSLISGVAAAGYIPYVEDFLAGVYASSETGTFAVFNIPLASGTSGYNIDFATAFRGTPTVLPSILCPNTGFINVYANYANRSGCGFNFSSTVTGTGYRLQVVAIDTFLVASGLAAILNASDAGLDLITAPTVGLQRQILGVQALNEKNEPDGYPGLDANGQIEVSALPSQYVNWDGGTTATGRIIQLKRASYSTLSTYVAASGEPLWATDTHELFIGNGVTSGGINVLSTLGSSYVRTTGNQTISGTKTFAGQVNISSYLNFPGAGGGISGDAISNTLIVEPTVVFPGCLGFSTGLAEGYLCAGTYLNQGGDIVVDFVNRIISGAWTFNVDGGTF